jgi:hypothetical protein
MRLALTEKKQIVLFLNVYEKLFFTYRGYHAASRAATSSALRPPFFSSEITLGSVDQPGGIIEVAPGPYRIE